MGHPSTGQIWPLGQGALPTIREEFAGTTASLLNLDTGNLDLDAYPSYALLGITLSHPCRCRLYTDNTSRANDAGRSVGTDPDPGSGLIAEVVSIQNDYRQKITPFVAGGNLDDPPTNKTYLSVTNQSGSTRPITVSLTLVSLEN